MFTVLSNDVEDISGFGTYDRLRCTYYLKGDSPMDKSENLKQEVKLFKNGNSYGFRISKKDREFLNIDKDTKFEKIVSSDNSEIIFKKIEKSRPNVLATANKLFDNNKELMKRLENL
ncbi:AbrB family transcriptional regulator [Companilactobacillus insicii]|uniref:AbrB family transcriptional regulator n=1 Tax=Companilactobacillus insicii TaxID=1732567 RepID=UPI001FEBDE08|nr:AbrB family transcriptional regulator [Companilactobacillus insicii]